MTGKELAQILRNNCLFLLPVDERLDIEYFIDVVEKLSVKTGRWVFDEKIYKEDLKRGSKHPRICKCSECGFHSRTDVFRYCPMCGANMKEGGVYKC